MTIPAPRKVDAAYAFARSHNTNKTLMFVSSCKQAQFMCEAFRLLNPGVKVLALHGKMKQGKRMAIYYEFISRRRHRACTGRGCEQRARARAADASPRRRCP